MRWVTQSNLGGEEAESIAKACDELGYEHLSLPCIPFSDELPDVPTDVVEIVREVSERG